MAAGLGRGVEGARASPPLCPQRGGPSTRGLLAQPASRGRCVREGPGGALRRSASGSTVLGAGCARGSVRSRMWNSCRRGGWSTGSRRGPSCWVDLCLGSRLRKKNPSARLCSRRRAPGSARAPPRVASSVSRFSAGPPSACAPSRVCDASLTRSWLRSLALSHAAEWSHALPHARGSPLAACVHRRSGRRTSRSMQRGWRSRGLHARCTSLSCCCKDRFCRWGLSRTRAETHSGTVQHEA